MAEISISLNIFPGGSGAGSALNPVILIIAGLCTAFATFVSAMSIYLHLKNYRKPLLQRMVARIMIMVPIYAISSLISLFSLEAAFVIDAIRDIYEAFVIYCFFNLLLGYLGGERSLLILLHGREPKPSVFPVSLIKAEFDVSDPYTFLFLKRGIMQYVQVKPVLAVATLILKAIGKYNEGNLRATSGYLYISIVYNTSICLSLYCLAMFWLCVNEDLQPFRPVPKFLCVKGILFFSFWQSIVISILVAAGAIKSLGPYTDSERISLGLTDTLICFEMPFFAIAHMYAFSHTDYIDRQVMYAARMPMYYAMRDAFGFKDVLEDTKATLRGEGMDYREFEPAEGFIHQGSGRDRRIKAGLRYSQGGKKKYWLPMPAESRERRDHRTVNTVIQEIVGGEQVEEVYAPLLQNQADAVVHTGPDLNSHFEEQLADRRGFDLPYGDPDEEDEVLYQHSRNYVFGDYHYPCIDVSSEYARKIMWDEEERVLRDERGAYFSPIRGSRGLLFEGGQVADYGTVSRPATVFPASTETKGKAPAKNKYRINQQGPAQDSAVIDMDHSRLDDLEDGARLRWSKKGVNNPDSPRSSPASPRNRILDDTSGHRSSSSRSSVSPTVDSHFTGRKQRPSPPSRTESNRAELPSDAIDLVVEDDHAAEDEMSRERRKGEPAVRGSGLRKVYMRGYFVPEGKVDEGSASHSKASTPQRTNSDLDEGYEDTSRGEQGNIVGASIEQVEGVEVARAATPPPHAQVKIDTYDAPINEENPWA